MQVGRSWLKDNLVELFNANAISHFNVFSPFTDCISKSCGELSNVLGLGEAFNQAHRAVDCQIPHAASSSMHVEGIAYLSIDSHAEVVAEMLGDRLSFYDLVLTVFYFLKLAVWLYLGLNHPNIQIFFLRAEPVGHSLLQFLEVVGQQVWAFLSPS